MSGSPDITLNTPIVAQQKTSTQKVNLSGDMSVCQRLTEMI